ncbi:MAG: hypothetical protein RL768_1795 [Nitrospirota bacterium]|jgi:hypothetical protein|nr:hypothetical protein [Nitrospira sp.]
MLKQIGKVGAIRREIRGKACASCGGHTYQIVLRSSLTPEDAKLFARCTHCQHPRGIDKNFGKILWM